MIIITPRPAPWPHNARRSSRLGFTLVEVLVSATLATFVLAAVLSTFVFLSRSGISLQFYSDMESQSRQGLELFAKDLRQASASQWNSKVEVRLTVDNALITYQYNSSQGTLSRHDASGTQVIISGIVDNTFTFQAYNISGHELPLNTADDLTQASEGTKQIQISMEAARGNRAMVLATNTVLSARYILRNKIVTV